MRAVIWTLVFCTVVGSTQAWGNESSVRLHGATTMISVVINPNKDAVEKSTGISLTIVGNATGKGLADLAAGKCDAALISEPMDIAIEAARTAGATIKPDEYEVHTVKKADIVFIVHASNPVQKLTWQQIKDIHTGKIRNWNELGGKDAPIIVYVDALTGGTRAMIKKLVLGGEEYSSTCRTLDAVRLVVSNVAEMRNGIGGAGSNFVDSNQVKIVETDKLERPLSFVTKGAPSPAVKKVIDAFAATQPALAPSPAPAASTK